MERGYRRGFGTAEMTEMWIGGSAVSPCARLGEYLASRHRQFISSWRRTAGSGPHPAGARGWH